MLCESCRTSPAGSREQVCTINAWFRRRRTAIVRSVGCFCRGLLPAVVISVMVATTLDVTAADAGDAGRQERRQAQGWLQLKQDQKTFRESVEPLTPRQAGRLDRLELYQEGWVRELDQRQRRSLNTERSFRRGADVERPKSRSRGLKEQRQLDRQRLEMRILRKTLRSGRF